MIAVNNAQHPLSGERLSRLYGGVLFWICQALLFCLALVMSDPKTLGGCVTIGVIVAGARAKDFRNRRERMRDQVWAEAVEQNPTAAKSQLLERAEIAWKQEVLVDCMRLCVEAALAALLCLLLMAAAVKQAGGRSYISALQILYSSTGRLTRGYAAYWLARLGLYVLTPFHALLVLVHWLLHRKTPDFSGMAWDLPSPPDHTAVARPLPVIELSGDPQSEENRALLTKRIREEREGSRSRIFVWALLAALTGLAILGLFESLGVLAVGSTILLFCTAGLYMNSLSTAYPLRQSERILSGLKDRPLLIEQDEILKLEKRGYINNLLGYMGDKSSQQRSEYGVVTLARAGSYAVGKGKSYLVATNPKEYAALPKKGPVWLVYVPNLEQPYAIVVTRRDRT